MVGLVTTRLPRPSPDHTFKLPGQRGPGSDVTAGPWACITVTGEGFMIRHEKTHNQRGDAVTLAAGLQRECSKSCK